MSPLVLAYYCSGHGYGHATRVSAFTRHLLSLPGVQQPIVYLVSSAPEHVFADSIACGARYRYAEIDPVIVQPLAYRVDRQKSVDALRNFLDKKPAMLVRESQWLLDINASAVLSDAAFLGCLAAKHAGVPSILITNFTFDSVYSYLSTPISDGPSESPNNLQPFSAFSELIPDVPVPHAVLHPLVEEIFSGYRCAQLLLLLPGNIPIPSFPITPLLPASNWVDVSTKRFLPSVTQYLGLRPCHHTLHQSLPFLDGNPPRLQREIIPAPLIVRPPNSQVYSADGRSSFLSSIGIPEYQHNSKILVVSFGGQVFRKPRSKSTSRMESAAHSRAHSPEFTQTLPLTAPLSPPESNPSSRQSSDGDNFPMIITADQTENDSLAILRFRKENRTSPALDRAATIIELPRLRPSRIATPSHIWIPGAPPASKQAPAIQASTINDLPTPPLTPSSQSVEMKFLEARSPSICSDDEGSLKYQYPDTNACCLLPSESWIAIVCGVSKEQWDGDDDELPDGFYVAPKNVYMPDLTATADVLLGKLGYGTVSECVDACTPFVYVSRPLFIEEHGLRLLLDREGVGIELSREGYEAGEWSVAVQDAWDRGRSAKERKKAEMQAGVGCGRRQEEGREMARGVVEWVQRWWGEDE